MKRTIRKMRGRVSRDDGNSLVEMALVSSFVLIPALFGIIEFSYGLYTYNWVNMVTRQATRYAVVRGAPSCQIQSGFQNCDLGPDSSNNATAASALQTYVASFAYPGIFTDNQHLSVSVLWLSPTVSSGTNGYSKTTWTTPCATSAPSTPKCNTPGYAVRVSVQYNFPLAIVGGRTLPFTATSQMVINE